MRRLVSGSLDRQILVAAHRESLGPANGRESLRKSTGHCLSQLNQLSLSLFVQLEPVARSFGRYVKVISNGGRTEPPALLLKSQQAAGGA